MTLPRVGAIPSPGPVTPAALPPRRRRAFTLIELLVVIGIIAVLIAILLPAVGAVRYQSKLATCEARLRQVGAAYAAYGIANEDALPNVTTPANGGVNFWDQSTTLYHILIDQYRYPHLMMFCPLSPDDLVDPLTGAWRQTESGGYYRFGYCFWTPYTTVYGKIPPSPGDRQGYQISGTDPIAGPARLTDPIARTNPVATDVVFTWAGAPVAASPSLDLSVTPPSQSGLYIFSQHTRRNGTLESINAVWLDGHVERIAGQSVHPRFLSRNNYWDWR